MMLKKLLFPQRCVSCGKFDVAYLCTDCFQHVPYAENQYCSICEKPAYHGITHEACQTRLGLDGHLSVTLYEGVTKDIVEFYKRRHVRKLENPIKDILELYLQGESELFNWTIGQSISIIPVPLFWIDQRLRPYNTAENIAAIVSKLLGYPLIPDLLEKVKPTRSQKHLPKHKRLRNLDGSFGVNRSVEGDIVLVDDVWTTGATLRECAKVLKKSGASKVFGLTFSRGI